MLGDGWNRWWGFRHALAMGTWQHSTVLSQHTAHSQLALHRTFANRNWTQNCRRRNTIAFYVLIMYPAALLNSRNSSNRLPMDSRPSSSCKWNHTLLVSFRLVSLWKDHLHGWKPWPHLNATNMPPVPQSPVVWIFFLTVQPFESNSNKVHKCFNICSLSQSIGSPPAPSSPEVNFI